MTPEQSSNLKQRYRGGLLGVVVGDALGAPFEGNETVGASEIEGDAERSGELRYTDDTHMTVGMAQSLLERRGFDGAHMAEQFARNYRSQPWRGYGPGPPQVFRLIEDGAAWDQAARALFDGAGSFGNGGAMRVVPAVLAAFDDLEQTVALARQTALITHAHPLGVDGAVFQACAVSLALGVAASGASEEDLRRRLRELHPLLGTTEFQDRLDAVLDAPTTLTPGEVVRRFGNGIEAIRSTPTALYCFLRHRRSFDEAIRFAISLGGDTDTIAAMTGALSGSFLGEAAIPDTWQRRVEAADSLRGLADRMFAMFAGSQRRE